MPAVDITNFPTMLTTVKAASPPATAVFTFNDIKDTISQEFGNGVDICGARVYSETIDEGEGAGLAAHAAVPHGGGAGPWLQCTWPCVVNRGPALKRMISSLPNASGAAVSAL